MDLVTYYKWDKVIYIYSDFDGFLRLQRIYQSIPRCTCYIFCVLLAQPCISFLSWSNRYQGAFAFQVELVKKIESGGDAKVGTDVQMNHYLAPHFGSRYS